MDHRREHQSRVKNICSAPPAAKNYSKEYRLNRIVPESVNDQEINGSAAHNEVHPGSIIC